MNRRLCAAALAAAVLLAVPVAEGRLADTLHNLSAGGPGQTKAESTTEICVFCHTPHGGGPRALWNQQLPVTSYSLYTSSTLEGSPRQPTGASRLCLSCHDGTTAPANLRVPPRDRRGAPTAVRGRLERLTGRAALGTDLSDDHPVSFVYDAALAARRGQLGSPRDLPATIRLDGTSQLQCTTCHDPHENPFRKFLRIDDRGGALCLACHRLRNWADSAHAISPRTWNGIGANPSPDTPHSKVADNACESCHRSHAAPRAPRLLGQARERDVCLVCHNGNVASKNLEAEFAKPSAHRIDTSDWTHDPREDPNSMPRHVTCVDCHDPHQVTARLAAAPAAPGSLRGARGANLAAASLASATTEYEVCLRCHGMRGETRSGAPVRQDNHRNIRLAIDSANPGYHPIAGPGKNPGLRGLQAGYSSGTLLYCGDCHNNDERGLAGRPRGAHGSRYAPILEREYQSADPTRESTQAYSLCYKCHNREYLLSDQSGSFPHRKHVVESDSACAACHDAHGARQAPHLINFMLRDRTGRVVVAPSQGLQRLEYVALGTGRGQCYLMCHGKNHEPASYP